MDQVGNFIYIIKIKTRKARKIYRRVRSQVWYMCGPFLLQILFGPGLLICMEKTSVDDLEPVYKVETHPKSKGPPLSTKILSSE